MAIITYYQTILGYIQQTSLITHCRYKYLAS